MCFHSSCILSLIIINNDLKYVYVNANYLGEFVKGNLRAKNDENSTFCAGSCTSIRASLEICFSNPKRETVKDLYICIVSPYYMGTSSKSVFLAG